MEIKKEEGPKKDVRVQPLRDELGGLNVVECTPKGESGTTLTIRDIGESELHEDYGGHGENNLVHTYQKYGSN